jgi:hypothetical protein
MVILLFRGRGNCKCFALNLDDSSWLDARNKTNLKKVVVVALP